jgi:hypothetical protein
VFSTGEKTLVQMSSGNLTAGQEMRFPDISTDRKYLTLDDLCGFPGGAGRC